MRTKVKIKRAKKFGHYYSDEVHQEVARPSGEEVLNYKEEQGKKIRMGIVSALKKQYFQI